MLQRETNHLFSDPDWQHSHWRWPICAPSETWQRPGRSRSWRARLARAWVAVEEKLRLVLFDPVLVCCVIRSLQRSLCSARAVERARSFLCPTTIDVQQSVLLFGPLEREIGAGGAANISPHLHHFSLLVWFSLAQFSSVQFRTFPDLPLEARIERKLLLARFRFICCCRSTRQVLNEKNNNNNSRVGLNWKFPPSERTLERLRVCHSKRARLCCATAIGKKQNLASQSRATSQSCVLRNCNNRPVWLWETIQHKVRKKNNTKWANKLARVALEPVWASFCQLKSNEPVRAYLLARFRFCSREPHAPLAYGSRREKARRGPQKGALLAAPPTIY